MPSRVVALRLYSVSMSALLVLSMAFAGEVLVSPRPQTTDTVLSPTAPHSAADFNNGTFVDWFRETSSSEEDWTQTRMNWLFGPKLSFTVCHENGTLITEDHYALIDEKLNFSVTVPNSIFPWGSEMGMLMFYGQIMSSDYSEVTLFLMAYAPGESNLTIVMSAPYPMMDWADSASPWYGLGNTFNTTKMQQTMSYKGAEMVDDFLTLYPSECANSSDDFNHYYSFIAGFTNDTPRAFYRVGMMVFDQEWKQIASYYYASSYEASGLAIGVPPSEAWGASYGGTYTLQKTDLEGNTLYSLSRNEDFRMRFNISGDAPEYVRLTFQAPQEIYMAVNRTGWHYEVVTETGGWVHDPDLQTYVWNASVEVAYEDYVYGEYQTMNYAAIPDDWQVEVRHLVYNEILQTYFVQNQTYAAQMKCRILYNGTTGTFEVSHGYEYATYPYSEYVEGEYSYVTVWVELASLEPLYVLNASLCSAEQTGNEFLVEFVGHFTEKMPVTDDYGDRQFDTMVVGSSGQYYSPATSGLAPRQSPADFNLAKRIIIESPVTIAKLLLENGEEPTGSIFQVDTGQAFRVLGRLQGGASSASEIDAVLLTLTTSNGYWTEEESQWSQLTYEIAIEMDGTTLLRAFNWTEKYNYTYGLYDDYVYTNVTGWHQVYDAVNNIWEWEYGEYWEWQWKQIEGWHWVSWFFNQETDEWQQNYISYRGSETEVPADFCTVSDFTCWLEEGDLYIEFNVTMSESAPESQYWWEFAFAADAWYVDDASSYGEHEVLSWDREWVYSFEDPDAPGEDIYVFPFSSQLAYYNDSLCMSEGVEYLKATERPYITISGEDLPIKVKERYDPYSTMTYDEMFFYDHYDPETGREYYRYELVNGTEIEVTYDEMLYIYNVTLANGMSFLTGQEWTYYWHDGAESYYYWIDTDGLLHQGDWSDYQPTEVVVFDTVEPDPYSYDYFIRYGETGVLYLDGSWRWDSRSDVYVMTDLDGNRYDVYWNSTVGYWTYFDGVSERVSYPERYYSLEYNSTEIILVAWDTHRSWYHEGDGVRYEMPYSGAKAEWWGDLAYTESQGGMVHSATTVTVGGVVRPVYESSGAWYVDVGATPYRLVQYNPLYSSANGTDIWDPTIPGYTVAAGTFDDTLAFTVVETVESQYNHMENIGGTDYLFLRNGTTWIGNSSTELLLIYEHELYGNTFYTIQGNPYYYDNGTHWYYYYEALNGSRYGFTEWDDPIQKSTHVEEVHYNGSDHVYEFMGDTYAFYWSGNYVEVYKILNATYGSVLYIPLTSSYGYGFTPIYQFMYDGTPVDATAAPENIRRVRNTWGYGVVYGPQPIESAVLKNFDYLVIGTPRWGMWDLREWTTNPDTGALDLDGDLDTIEDQYYVLEVYTSTESWNRTWDTMTVNLLWDPNVTLYGDELDLTSWMGLNTFTWTYDWQRNYYWYHVDTRQLISDEEFDVVNATVNDEYGDPRPGYWSIAYMTENTSYADYLAEALAKGWSWVSSNTRTWTWLSFGMKENYGISYGNETVVNWIDVSMHYEFSGFMIWEDDSPMNNKMDVNPLSPTYSELTHYFIPDGVANLTFLTPGLAYGNLNASGDIRVEIDDEVTWGVTYYNVTGTVFPYTITGYWGWYEGVKTTTDLRTFDEKPTDVSIDEVSFTVHFQGQLNMTSGAMNNQVALKVDNYIGNWDVDMLGGRTNLENRSLAVNYLADVTAEEYAFLADGTPTSGTSAQSAEHFQFSTAQAQFADLIMGGTTYDWGKNLTAGHDVLSQTTPIGTLESVFESQAGKSATSWNFTETMFYVTVGFPYWDGYSINNDPVFVSYVSSRGTTASVTFGVLSRSPMSPSATDEVDVSVSVSSMVTIDSVDLLYSTDQLTWQTTSMTPTADQWTGQIPAHAEGTTVYYKVVAHTAYGDYESITESYVVGSETTPTTSTATTTVVPPPIQWDILFLLAGVGVTVVVIVAVFARRRR